ncbi:toxin glutamine deamidase domain-containing protein [Plantactinospora sp. KBS50]|uniref:toxin glutamine deamidase domain-containing protein n=1 Tax=Plantactinospora sp. KBS50 TaxID=2024580 RepID=UPI0012FE626D|nr:toxin glutamine deamidase domain-containing protein [Plantactinospora sp. KBS50]
MSVPNPKSTLGEYGWVWDAICWVGAGEAWPSGDEDKMRELAEVWSQLSDEISNVLGDADGAAMVILENWGGGAGPAFGELWTQLGVGPNTGLPLLQEAASQFSAGCENAAMEIEYAKLTVLISVIITVIAVFVALLMAWLGGVSAGAIPGILQGGRQAVMMAFRRLLAQLGRKFFTKEGLKLLFRTTVREVGQQVSRQSARQLAKHIGRELIEEVGEELIIDAGAQAYQMAKGTRTEWDVKRTLTSGAGGAFGVGVGLGLNKLGGRLAPRVLTRFDVPVVHFPGKHALQSGLQNAVISPTASVLANLAVNQQFQMPTASDLLGGFTSGAGRTGAEAGGHLAGHGLANLANNIAGLNGGTGGAGGGTGAGAGTGIGTGTGAGLGAGTGLGGATGTGSASTGSTSNSGSTTSGSTTSGSTTSGSTSSGSNVGGSSQGTGGTTQSGTTQSGTTQSGTTQSGTTQNGTTGGAPPPNGSVAYQAPSAGTAEPVHAGTDASASTSTAPSHAAPSPAAPVPVAAAPISSADTGGTTPPADPAHASGSDSTGPPLVASQAGGPGSGPVAAPGTPTGPQAQVNPAPAGATPGGPTGVNPAAGTAVNPVAGSTVNPAGTTVNPAASGPVVANPTTGSPTSTAPGSNATTGGPGNPAAGPNTGATQQSNTGTSTAGTSTTGAQGGGAVRPNVTTTASNSAGSVTVNPANPTGNQPTGTPGPSQQSTSAASNPQGSARADGRTAVPAGGHPAGTVPADPGQRPDGQHAAAPRADSAPDQRPNHDATTVVPLVSAGGHPGADTTGHPATDPAGQQRTDPVGHPASDPHASPVSDSAANPAPASTGAVDPGSLERSTGPTANGTHSWRLDPTLVDGDPTGPEAERALIDASRTLADAVQAAAGQGDISRAKYPGMAGALLTPDGQITTHTSMTADKSTNPVTNPAPHPVAQQILDRIKQQVEQPGAGHGKCAEVALVSDALYRLQRQWEAAGRPGGDFEAYARSALAGAKIVTHQVNPAVDGDVRYEHGNYRPPCRSCEVFLSDLGIEPVADPQRPPGWQPPPVESAALANGQPLVDSRPYGDPQGLIPPDPSDQQALSDAVPQGPDGRPAVHPDPRTGTWSQQVNDGGPANPGRNNNCADVGLSFLSTWYGDPQVAASAANPGSMEAGSTARQQQWLGTDFAHQGSGVTGLDAVAERLRQAGPGSAALVITSWTADVGGGAHTWNAVNVNGTVVWVDAQIRAVSDTGPIHTNGVDGVWSITLDANGDPFTAGVAPPGTATAGADPGPGVAGTRPDNASGPSRDPSPSPDASSSPDGGPTDPNADTDPTTDNDGDGDPDTDQDRDPDAEQEQEQEQDHGPDPAADVEATDDSGTPNFDELSADEQQLLLDVLAGARPDADAILGDLEGVSGEINQRLGLTGDDALTPLGAEHRVKTAESLARKYLAEFEFQDVSLDSALGDVNDIVRFSLRGPESAAYGPAVDAVLRGLEEKGYQLTDVKNFWQPGNRFFGLNCTLGSPGGRTFELQFPTATSWAVGKQTHDAYEIVRDVDASAADRMHALLDILSINKASGIASRMPGGLDAPGGPIPGAMDTSVATWIGSASNADLRQEYVGWLARQGRTFADDLAGRGLTPSDLPGLDPNLLGSPDGDAHVQLLPADEAKGPGGSTGQRDGSGPRGRSNAGGVLGLSEQQVGIPSGGRRGPAVRGLESEGPSVGRPRDGGADGSGLHGRAVADGGGADGDLPHRAQTAEPADLSDGEADLRLLPDDETDRAGRASGERSGRGGQSRSDSGGVPGLPAQDLGVPPGSGSDVAGPGPGRPYPHTSGPGDGGAGDGGVHAGAVAERGGADPDLSGGRPERAPGNVEVGDSGPHPESPQDGGPSDQSGRPPLPGTRVEGPGELAPIESPQFQADLASSLLDPGGDGFVVGANPATHPYGQIVNDGGPLVRGRSNNCLDCSLSALSSFAGVPQVSAPRWADVNPDGLVDSQSGERGGIARASQWLGGQWNPLPTMPGTPAERAAWVSWQYDMLQHQVAQEGPGASALVVADWVAFDPHTGQPMVDLDGNVQSAGAHAFVIVNPADGSGPVWWDPQSGMTWSQPPAQYVAATHTLYSMPLAPVSPTGGPPTSNTVAGTDQQGGGRPTHEARPFADGEGTDPDLPGGQQPVADPHPEPQGAAALSDLAGTRVIGPGELAPVESPEYRTYVASTLVRPDGNGYVLGANPATHPYGQIVNDGGPLVRGRSNNCLDCSLSALSSFAGEPQVSAPRWADVGPDGSVDSQSGERGGIARASQWLGGQWDAQPADLPGTPAERAPRVAQQYADLHRRIAEAGPGASALVVADWVAFDPLTGQPVVDVDGNVRSAGAHAFVIVNPADGSGPVWWDPQSGMTWSQPPVDYLAATHTLWSMPAPMVNLGVAVDTAGNAPDSVTPPGRTTDPSAEGGHDGGRGTRADESAPRDAESDSASPVRVRLGGAGDPLAGTAGAGDARGSGRVHHRPGRGGDGASQPATSTDHRGVQGSEADGADVRSPGLADDGATGDVAAGSDGVDPGPSDGPGSVSGRPGGGEPGDGPPGDGGGLDDDGGPDLWRAATGATFGGALLDADPARTGVAIRRALTDGPLPMGAAVDAAAGTVTLDTATGPFRVTIVPVIVPADLPVAPVASIDMSGPEAVVRVSASAEPDHIRCAVAAALAEVDTVAQDRAVGLRLDATTALAEGARPEGSGERVLTPPTWAASPSCGSRWRTPGPPRAIRRGRRRPGRRRSAC